jgi:hypothetical protein
LTREPLDPSLFPCVVRVKNMWIHEFDGHTLRRPGLGAWSEWCLLCLRNELGSVYFFPQPGLWHAYGFFMTW